MSADLACIVPSCLDEGEQGLVAGRVQMEHLNRQYTMAGLTAQKQAARPDRYVHSAGAPVIGLCLRCSAIPSVCLSQECRCLWL